MRGLPRLGADGPSAEAGDDVEPSRDVRAPSGIYLT